MHFDAIFAENARPSRHPCCGVMLNDAPTASRCSLHQFKTTAQISRR
jgi:hypothetical protein